MCNVSSSDKELHPEITTGIGHQATTVFIDSISHVYGTLTISAHISAAKRALCATSLTHFSSTNGPRAYTIANTGIPRIYASLHTRPKSRIISYSNSLPRLI